MVTRPGEPVLPLELRNVSAPNLVLRGIGFRGGNYLDYLNTAPLTGAPATEVRGVHPPFWTDVFFPIRMWNANYFDILANPTDGITRLALVPGQFLSDGQDSYFGTMRIFEEMDFRLYYSANTEEYNGNVPALASPPTIAKVLANENGTDVEFQTYVVGDLSAGVQEVWVTYSGVEPSPFYGSWQTLELAQKVDDSRIWVGSLTLPIGASAGDLRYIVQAANGVGLVSLNTNLGQFFTPDIDPGDPPATGDPTSLDLAPMSPAQGKYYEEVTLSATLTNSNPIPAGQVIWFALGSQIRRGQTDGNGVAEVKFPLLSPPGTYKVRAAFIGNNEYQGSADVIASFNIEKQPTVLNLVPNAYTIDDQSAAVYVLELADIENRPLSQKTVFLVVKDGGTIVHRSSAITDFLGRAKLKIAGLSPGPYTVESYFSGDVPISPTLTLTLNDPNYHASMVAGSLMVENSIVTVIEPIKVNTVVEAHAAFIPLQDTNKDNYKLVWSWGDGSTSEVNILGINGLGTATGEHIYTTPGVYTLKATALHNPEPVSNLVWDPFWEAEYQYITVYDPSGGFVTGGGWIWSETGYCLLDDACSGAEGKAIFGFVSKYKKGTDEPTGKTEFRFKTGNLIFQSSDYQWLVVAGHTARFKGFGTINGVGNYGFMISAIDSDLTPSINTDLFRIKIWDIADNDRIVYDNQMEADDDADPTTALGGGSITIHKVK